MNNNVFYSCLFLLIITIGCSKDESQNNSEKPDSEQSQEEKEEGTEDSSDSTLAVKQAETLSLIASDAEKTWRFEQVVLSNENGNFDISQNFNVVDDELVFRNYAKESEKGSEDFIGSLVWRQKNVIFYNANSVESAKYEHYVSPRVYNFNFIPNSSEEIFVDSLDFNFFLEDDNKLRGTFILRDGVSLEVVAVEKTDSDFLRVPSEALNFTTVFEFTSNGIDNQAADIVGSLLSNSLYVVTREDEENEYGNTENYERVIRYSFSEDIVTDRIYNNPDFASKEAFIYQNQLLVVGGQRVNLYDLDLKNQPRSTSNYSQTSTYDFTYFTRFGSAIVDESVFIVGGFLGSDYLYADKIFKFDVQTETISDFMTMPEKSFGARSEIVGNKLYIFGGTDEYYGHNARNSILIYNIKTGELENAEMSDSVHFTFTGKQGNLIYVAGRIDKYVEDVLVDRDPFLGVFDVLTNKFTELETNLESYSFETIHSMTVFNKKMYILFGESDDLPKGDIPQEWSVLSVDL